MLNGGFFGFVEGRQGGFGGSSFEGSRGSGGSVGARLAGLGGNAPPLNQRPVQHRTENEQPQ